MNRVRGFCKRVFGLFGRERRDAELIAELESHLALHIEENLRAGMTPEEARRQALIKLGGLEQIKESYRDRRGRPWLDSLLQDIRFGLRMLRKNPGFTAVAILTLALGIGANTAIFSVVNGILLEPLPYPNASRLVLIGAHWKIHGVENNYRQGISVPAIDDIRSQTTAFERVAVSQGNFADRIRTDLMPDVVNTSQVSEDFFALLGGRPIIGRPIQPQDEADGGKQVAVLSYKLWQQDFGGDANVLSRTLLIEDKPYQVIGVMPRGFEFGQNEGKGLWTPILESPNPRFRGRAGQGYQAVALLKKGVSKDRAAAQLSTLSARLSAAYPSTDKDLNLVADSPKDEMVQRIRTGLLILLGAVGFVLLIACVNVSALLVARAWTRQREIAIRKALGATKMRLVRQLLSESAILAFLGGALGLLASLGTIRALRALAPPYTPRIESVRIDANVLWFTLGISLVAALLFGIAPAMQASARRLGGNVRDTLGASLTAGVTPRRHLLRSALVAVEVSLAVILVLGAALMLRSFEKLMHVEIGFRTDHLLTMHAYASDAICAYKAPPQQCESAKDEILRRIESLPGVEKVAISQGYAMLGGGYVFGDLWLEGSQGDLMTQPNKVGGGLLYHVITTDYFDVLGLRILEGRKFNDGDTADAPAVVIVNKAFASMFLPAEPLGKRFAVSKDKQGNPKWMQVVGIVNDDRDMAVKTAPEPLFYQPARQIGYFGVDDYIVRTSDNPIALAPAIEKQIWSIDKDSPIQNIETMDQHIADSVAEPRFQTALLASFGVLGLLLSIVGVYGVMSYAVVQRTHEIGVRMALGAKPADVMRLVVGEGAKLALVGIAAGLAASWGLARFLRSLLFEVAPNDPTTFAAIGVTILFVAIAACYFPARRAMRVDPMIALRHD